MMDGVSQLEASSANSFYLMSKFISNATTEFFFHRFSLRKHKLAQGNKWKGTPLGMLKTKNPHRKIRDRKNMQEMHHLSFQIRIQREN